MNEYQRQQIEKQIEILKSLKTDADDMIQTMQHASVKISIPNYDNYHNHAASLRDALKNDIVKLEQELYAPTK